jgi:hypothetical protein
VGTSAERTTACLEVALPAMSASSRLLPAPRLPEHDQAVPVSRPRLVHETLRHGDLGVASHCDRGAAPDALTHVAAL